MEEVAASIDWKDFAMVKSSTRSARRDLRDLG